MNIAMIYFISIRRHILNESLTMNIAVIRCNVKFLSL
jgi:hypothetical protein